MNIKLSNGKRAAPNDITALQRKIGELLPSEYLRFLAKNDGAEPETNIFKVGELNDSSVSAFIPIKDIIHEMQYIENIPCKAFPVAWAEGGNFILMNQAAQGEILFWDHELPEEMLKIADSFDHFLDSLKPFDINSVKLKPGQVQKAWIDPNFLKSLQE